MNNKKIYMVSSFYIDGDDSEIIKNLMVFSDFTKAEKYVRYLLIDEDNYKEKNLKDFKMFWDQENFGWYWNNEYKIEEFEINSHLKNVKNKIIYHQKEIESLKKIYNGK